MIHVRRQLATGLLFLCALCGLPVLAVEIEVKQPLPVLPNKRDWPEEILTPSPDHSITIKIIGERGTMYLIRVSDNGRARDVTYLVSKEWAGKILNLSNAETAAAINDVATHATEAPERCQISTDKPENAAGSHKRDRLKGELSLAVTRERYRNRLHFDRWWICKGFPEYEASFRKQKVSLDPLRQALRYYGMNPGQTRSTLITIRDYSVDPSTPKEFTVDLKERTINPSGDDPLIKSVVGNDRSCSAFKRRYPQEKVGLHVKEGALYLNYVPQCQEEMERSNKEARGWQQFCSYLPTPKPRYDRDQENNPRPLEDENFNERFEDLLKFESSF